jgi:hypothetical protein
MHCGKCGADIGGHLGPCPSCKDQPFGKFREILPKTDPPDLRGQFNPPPVVYEAWKKTLDDILKIREIVDGFGDDEDAAALYDRCLMVWEVVRPYKEES